MYANQKIEQNGAAQAADIMLRKRNQERFAK